MEQTKTKQGNVCAKWEITRKELQEAVDELCAKGDAEGHGGIAANATNIYTELPAA